MISAERIDCGFQIEKATEFDRRDSDRIEERETKNLSFFLMSLSSFLSLSLLQQRECIGIMPWHKQTKHPLCVNISYIGGTQMATFCGKVYRAIAVIDTAAGERKKGLPGRVGRGRGGAAL